MISRLQLAGILAFAGMAAAKPPAVSTTTLPDATVGVLYRQALSAQGGKAPYSWSITSGSLPPGLALNSEGAIGGTPTATGTANFSVKVTDKQGEDSPPQALSITTAAAPLVVTTSSLPDATVGVTYSQSLGANGGAGGNRWSLRAGSLPGGMSLSSGGTISGTPATSGSAAFTVEVTDTAGSRAGKSLTLNANAAPLKVTTSALPEGTAGSPYSGSLSASGGTGGYTWSVSAGSLPDGLALSPGGAISGTPTTPGSQNFTVQVKDSSNATATRQLSINVAPTALTVTTSSLANGTVGTPYSQALSASGGTGGYSWAIVSGSLPAGLSLNRATIGGTPTAAGASSFQVQVRDSSGATASQSLSITVSPAPPSVTTSSLPNGAVGAPYSQTLAASGGSPPYSWSIQTGALPAGLALSGATISGTPTAAGASSFTVQATDSAGVTASKALGITVNPAPLTITTTSLPDAMVGAPYSQSLSASGGSGTYSWSIQSGALPTGLSLNGGAISGTPTGTGTANFKVQVTDGAGATATKQLSIAVAPSSLAISTASLATGAVSTPYSQTLAATGGSSPYTWSIQSGSLPAGLSLSGANISGTPSAPGTSSFTVQVTDAANATATKSLSLTINGPALAVGTTSLPPGTVNTPYSQSLAATGGSSPYTWSIQSGSLPAGLSLSGATISGTPTAAGTSTFTVQVTDAANATATQSLSITVNGPALTVSTTSLPPGTVNTPYSQSLAATGGSSPYSWSIQSGSLPAGLSLNGASISGTPTAAGTSGFTVQVTDAANATASKSLSITINGPTLAVGTTSLAPGTVNSPYSQSLAATGGSSPYTWSIQSGSLPAGLSLNGASISGTPTATGTSGFTVQVTDAANATASKSLSITVNGPTLTIAAASLPTAIVSAPYSQNLSATGGSGAYSWSIVSGSLPAGLSLSGSTISGTPTAAGVSSFTVQVTDGAGSTASRLMSLAVNQSTLTITTGAVLSNGVIGIPYSQSVSASGGSGAYSWSVVSGSLPPGLSMNGATIAGTPVTAGTYGFTLQVSDSTGATTAKQFAITVAGPPLTVTTNSLSDATAGSLYTQTLSATGGTNIYSWNVLNGQLPPGLSLASNGALAGTPLTGGTYTFTVQVTDSSLAHATATLTITVRVPLTILTPAVLAAGSAGRPYSQALAAQGGSGSLTWSLASGTLSNGLTLHPNGVIDGTPTQVGSFSFAVQVADASGATVSRTFSLSIASGLTIATPPVLPAATVSAPYSLSLQPAGGTAPYVWSVSAGSLPAGLTFGADGKITGTPGTAGAFTFTAQLTDANSAQTSKQFSLTVASALLISTGPTLPNGASFAPYQATLAAIGGNPPYLWSVTAGALPPGLTLDSSGSVGGTPSASGTFTFTATVTDSSNLTAQRQFTISIGQGLTITSAASLPNATAGTPYTATLAASGGQAPYSWSVSSGSLPPGLSLNAATGTIAGTPGAIGVFNFTVQVTDATKLVAAGVHTIAVGLPALSAMTLNGPPANAAPLQQPSIDIAIANPYPVDITGVLALAFTPGGANPADDPAVQFSTGGRTASFTIPANSLHAVFAGSQLALQTGSVTGNIQLSVQSLQAGGNALAVPAGLTSTTQVAASAPIIQSVALVSTNGGFQVQIVGLSSTREMTQAVISFVPAAGGSLQTGQLTVPLASAAQSWFQSSDSKPFGGQFTLTLPFSVQGASNAVGSVSVVLSNTAGDSPAASGSFN